MAAPGQRLRGAARRLALLLPAIGLAAACQRPPPCFTAAARQRLGAEHLLVGGALSDEAAAGLPLDVRHQYLTGPLPDAPCGVCRECAAAGESCANGKGCRWWGCWQYDGDAPGRFPAEFAARAAAGGAVPMFTYYAWLSASGGREGPPEIEALRDPARVGAWLADVARMARAVGAAGRPALVHLEPDLWGFAQRQAEHPEQIPVAMGGAPPECAGRPGNLAGLAGCALRLVRLHAPAALAGLHASSWAAGPLDAFRNTDRAFDREGHARRTAAFLRALGADGTDFVGVEMNHRDAGFNREWWDATDRRLPSFAQAVAWVTDVSRELRVPPVFWQVPYGHEGLPDRCGEYRDNRLDWVFEHEGLLARAGVLGVVFGAGAECMTRPETDGGHFRRRLLRRAESGRARLCEGP